MAVNCTYRCNIAHLRAPIFARAPRLAADENQPKNAAARAPPHHPPDAAAPARATMRATPRARGASKRDDADARRSTGATRARRLVVFRRGAYKGLKEKPPFRTTWDVPCERLDVKLGHRDGTASRFGSIVTVSCDVEPVGAHGFFLAAAIRGAVDCACASCGVVFARALPEHRDDGGDDDDDVVVDAPCAFTAWLDPDFVSTADGASSASGDAEVYPFPPSRDAVDLTDLVVDTIDAFGVPDECVCDACRAAEPRAWSTERAM